MNRGRIGRGQMTYKDDSTGLNGRQDRSGTFDEYSALMGALHVGVSKHKLDEHFTAIWANDFFFEIIKYTREEYVALFHNHVDEYFASAPAALQKITQSVLGALAENRPGYECICQMPQKGGSMAWIRFVGIFTDEIADGFPVVYTVFTDVTDIIQTQKEQSVTYDNLPGFVAKIRVEDEGFTLIEANARFRDFFSGGKDFLSYGLANIDCEQNRAAYAENIDAMKKGLPVHFTLQAKDSGGGDAWLQVNAECVRWDGGRPVYLVIYIDITDITEQRALRRQLEERSEMLRGALAEAERANRAKSDFLSRMSHDIRSPMNAVIGMTAIAASHIDNRERVMDCLEKIAISSKLLLQLINEVLDMAKIESGRLELAEDEVSLDELLQGIVTIMQPSIAEKRHNFDIHVYELEHERVVCDQPHIQQVFLNILSNAVKYTPEGGNIIFEVRENPSDIKGYGQFEFTFEDSGLGMKPEFLKKIFTPFERADDVAAYGIQGTGLGLAISKNIVGMMNGEISVSSIHGKGTKFTVKLPLKTADLKEEPASPLLSPLPSLPVLVVDDDRIVCETVSARLAEIGMESRCVLSGKEALQEAVSAHRAGADFFMIIIDLMMPGMDGIETAREIRAAVGPEVPIILLSGYGWAEYEAKALAAGINGFIMKPLFKSSLIGAIRRYALKEAVPETLPAAPHIAASYEGKRALLVEDNAINREIAQEILGQTGIIVESAEHGLEALEKFAASDTGYYDVVFMDLQMPVMGGLEAARRIRGLERSDSPSVPIIAMTANAFEDDVKASKEAGMNAHLSKPLDFKLLERAMAEYLGG